MKALIVIFTFCSFSLGIIFPAWCGEEDVLLKCKGEILSANLKEITLKMILEKLGKERGVWFKCDNRVLDSKVSAHFKGLSLEEGLKRILSSMNYSLVFDSDRRLVGLIIIGKGSPGIAKVNRGAVPSRKTISSPGKREQANVKGPFKVIRNIPPPGGRVKTTREEIENFKVIKNSPPPGGPVKATAKEIENFKVIKNLPPPGGPVEVTPEELDKFKVIKNCPPPGSQSLFVSP